MSSGRIDPPTLINLPPPPAEPLTPSDLPGTPNSTTTSMSELSTVAIKDGHRGHLPHHHSSHPVDVAERADRISRLPGFDRVAPQPSRNLTASNAGSLATGTYPAQAQAYFDANNQPQMLRERSTVGSASATGSVGGRTTWASGSDAYADDKTSEDMDVDGESMGGFSDEAASLVGFGEGARTPARTLSIVGSPAPAKAGAPIASSSSSSSTAAAAAAAAQTGAPVATALRQAAAIPPSPLSAGSTPSVETQRQNARMIDGMTYDAAFVDTANRTPPPVEEENGSAAERQPQGRQLRSNGPVA